MRVGSLCTGYGGLDLAVERVIGGEMVWCAEVDPHACRVLAARWPGVPNLGDITTVDWSQVEPVDVLTAGFPCQDISYAGKGAGLDGERSSLWFDVLRAVRVLRPRLLVVENVGAIRSRGLDVVTHGLASCGYVGSWVSLRASDVGACHGRDRVFLAATHADSRRLAECGESDGGAFRPGLAASRRGDAHRRDSDAADADGTGLEGRDAVRGGGRERAVGAGGLATAADATDIGFQRDRDARRGRAGSADGCRIDWGAYGPAVARHAHAVGRPAPNPTDDDGRLSPRFVEWMMMLPDGWVTDIVTSRSAALRLLGNGVVPAQAAAAISHLLRKEAAA